MEIRFHKEVDVNLVRHDPFKAVGKRQSSVFMPLVQEPVGLMADGVNVIGWPRIIVGDDGCDVTVHGRNFSGERCDIVRAVTHSNRVDMIVVRKQSLSVRFDLWQWLFAEEHQPVDVVPNQIQKRVFGHGLKEFGTPVDPFLIMDIALAQEWCCDEDGQPALRHTMTKPSG